MNERYVRPEMKTLWSDRTRYETWLEVELAICRAMEAEGSVPTGTADGVRLKVNLDCERIRQIEAEVGHEVMALLIHVEEQAGDRASWLHRGLTAADVTDTGLSLQLRQAGRILLESLDLLGAALAKRAREAQSTPLVGRTHGMHAEPITVGLVFARHYAEMMRHRVRLVQAIEDMAVGKVSGAVGTYSNVDPAIEREALAALGLAPDPCSTQIIPRDRHAHFFCTLAQIGTSIEKLAFQVRNWQRQEVAEVREEGRRTPVHSENLCGLARLTRSYALAALENVALWHERDMSHSSVERMIAPTATAVLDFMLHRATNVVEGLQIDEQRLARNIEETRGLIFAEAVILTLVEKGMSQQAAYELVQEQARRCRAGEGTLQDLLAGDAEISRRLSEEALASCFSVSQRLRNIDLIFERVLGDT